MFSQYRRRGPVMSALKRFSFERDPKTRLFHPVLPADFQEVHAIVDVSLAPRTSGNAKDPYFIEGTEDFEIAMCGTKVKVVLPVKFNESDRQACKKCVRASAEHQESIRQLTNSSMVARNYKSVKL